MVGGGPDIECHEINEAHSDFEIILIITYTLLVISMDVVVEESPLC